MDKNLYPNLDKIAQEEKVTVTKMSGITLELAEKMLVKFDGNKLKLNEFIDNCDKAYTLVNDNLKEILFAIIETKITDKARALIRNKEFNSWKELKEHLIDIYSDKRTMGQWQLELNSLKQGIGEPVLSFANKVENCYIKLINSLDSKLDKEAKKACVNLRKGQALSVFVSGLNKDIAIIVKAQKPENLETAIALAISEEQETKAKTEIQKHQNLYNSQKFCAVCKKTISNHNPNFNNSNVNSSNTNFHSKDRQNFNNNKTCNYCKRTGHVIQECRKKQFNDNKRKQGQSISNNSQTANTQLLTLNTQTTSETATPRLSNQIMAEYSQ